MIFNYFYITKEIVLSQTMDSWNWWLNTNYRFEIKMISEKWISHCAASEACDRTLVASVPIMNLEVH